MVCFALKEKVNFKAIDHSYHSSVPSAVHNSATRPVSLHLVICVRGRLPLSFSFKVSVLFYCKVFLCCVFGT